MNSLQGGNKTRQGKTEGRTERTHSIVTIINMQQSIKERTVLAKEQQLQAHRKDLPERCVGQVRKGGRHEGQLGSVVLQCVG